MDEKKAIGGLYMKCSNTGKKEVSMPSTYLAERRASVRNECCFACLQPIPVGTAVYHGELRILTHRGACTEAVDAEQREPTPSGRGRWRPRGEVIRRIVAHRSV